MLSKLKTVLERENFQPSWLGLFINPFFFARKGLYQQIEALASRITGRTLDVGCGNKPYERLFNATSYAGLEIDSADNRKNKKADYFYDGNQFPFGDGEFDSLVTFQVFEHVFTPDSFLNEVNRVLKADGVLLVTVPFVWDEHEQPHDFARYSSFGLGSLLKRHGFEIVEQRKSIDDIRVVFQLLNGYIYKKTVSGNRFINMVAMIILMAPWNILGEFLAMVLPKNGDLYLDNIVLAKKVNNE
jgi:SAM-dependent methyltransferase